MNPASLFDRLELLVPVLRGIIAALPEGDLKWRPADGGWSVLEILCHLADEETDDFRPRLEITLSGRKEPWPPIDPPQAAIARDYQSQPAVEVMERLAVERSRSLVWLRQLDTPQWENAYHHPVLGRIRAGDLLAAWVAHDALHLRQVAKRLFQMTQRDAGEYQTAYAGNWSA